MVLPRIRRPIFASRIAQYIHSWSRNTPLPAYSTDISLFFQEWNEFDTASKRWSQVDTSRADEPTGSAPQTSAKLVLATWNVDAGSKMPRERLSAIMAHLASLVPAPDVVFLQEVNHSALAFLLHDDWVRREWFSSETSARNWGEQSFGTVTLLSKALFKDTPGSEKKARLGPIWRVRYPSRYGRDALCCDVFTGLSSRRVRLINVHLDSLQLNPSRRPRQLAVAASMLRSAGRGIVAGDFNPVGPEDRGLVKGNGLVDAWDEVRPGEDGFTWGVDGKHRFPPGRFDKFALLDVGASDIEVMLPRILAKTGDEGNGAALDHNEKPLRWSDHSGVRCCISVE